MDATVAELAEAVNIALGVNRDLLNRVECLERDLQTEKSLGMSRDRVHQVRVGELEKELEKSTAGKNNNRVKTIHK